MCQLLILIGQLNLYLCRFMTQKTQQTVEIIAQNRFFELLSALTLTKKSDGVID